MSSSSNADPGNQAWLELPGGPLFFLRERNTIGRLPGNDVVLPDDALSRQHAVIALGPNGYVLTDMGSRNGSYVGGKLLSRPVTLRDGDRLRLGTVELRFRSMRRNAPPDPNQLNASDGQTTHALTKFEARDCWLASATVENFAATANATGRERALRELQAWIAGLRGLLEQHGGQINHYAGDTMLAYWPCDGTKPADVLLSLQAVDTWRPHSALPFRVVVHHGKVLISGTAKGEEITGRDVVFVSRMQKLAPGVGPPVVLSAAAARTLGIEERGETFGPLSLGDSTEVFTFYGLPRGRRPRTDAAVDEAGEVISDSGKAVFLSYASQDSEIARRICEALRAADVEVWFDQSELRGGDAWDHKIRRQVKACALFVPIISANTQARREGYFRIEWKLAAQRTHAIADGVPFVLPIVVDATPQPSALVPAEFHDVQWMWLRQPSDATTFARRVRDLVEPPSVRESGTTRPPMPIPGRGLAGGESNR